MSTGILEVLIPRPNTAIVTKSGDDSKGAIGGTPFFTINGAISAIHTSGATGITILVYPGIYDEKMVIPPECSLWG